MLECTPPRGHQPEQVQPPALARRRQRVAQHPVLGERAVRHGVVDAREVLAHDLPGAQVQVADLGVAHLPLGQAHRPAAGGELGVLVALPERVEDRRLGQLDGVAGARRRPAPSRRGSPGRRRPAACQLIPSRRPRSARSRRGRGSRRPRARRPRRAGTGSRRRCRASRCRRTGSGSRAAASSERLATSARTKAIASCAWSGVATLPVPIAQIGS